MLYALADSLAVLQITQAADSLTATFELSCRLEDDCLCAIIIDKNGNSTLHSELIKSNNELRRKTVKAAVILLQQYSPSGLDGWGILRGVRPTKLAAQLIDAYSYPLARQILTRDCLLEPQIVELLMAIAKTEADYLQKLNLPAAAACVYIGVPFCPTRCGYCSFTSFPVPAEKVIENYLAAVRRELQATAAIALRTGKQIVSLYVGGGTPVSLPPIYFTELLASIRDQFPNVTEFTVECGRPELISHEILSAINSNAVSRICINPQSFNDSTLRRIGRTHSAKAVYEAFALTRQEFPGSVNMDVIAGLEGETFVEFRNTIDKIIDLKPENITVHSLALKRGAAMAATLADRQQVEKMLRYAYSNSQAQHYSPYYLYRQKNSIGENIGYCLDKCQCLYNIMIIEEQHSVFGIGPGAATKAIFDKHLKSVYNPKDYRTYIDHIDEYISKKSRLFEERPAGSI